MGAHDAPPDRRLGRVVFAVGVALSALLMFLGAWERRWIADDGLIVLRTVRNLLAGNGPVFNIGERVEANTSTLWTYLVYAAGRLTGIRLEYVVLGIALVLSTTAVVLAMFGAARLYRWRLRDAGGALLLLPAGVLVYIAVPPARDFATSGLETCLVICWIGLLWLLMMRWATPDPERARPLPGTAQILGTAFVAGLGPLVRPELALLAVLALLMLFLTPDLTWRVRAAMVAVAGGVPVGYQIWRMGYYGLPYPNTAVSKDAGGAKWSQGFEYLGNLVSPYLLWLPFLFLAVAAAAVLMTTRRRERPAGGPVPAARPWEVRGLDARTVVARAQRALRTPTAVVGFALVSGLALALYSMRVGGDFMHGRVLLPPMFCLLLPVAVLPLRLPERSRIGNDAPTRFAAGMAFLWLGTIVWSFFASNTTGMVEGAVVGRSGIVDERAFYALNTGHLHPIRAEDYLDYPRMRAMVGAIADNPNGGLLLPTPSFDTWDVVPPPEPIPPGGAGHTVFFLNLGMTSMNTSLQTRVVDQMGLAYPLASHTERLEDGRIGHDKILYPDWVVADTGMVDVHPWLPAYLDEDWVAMAQVALTCPQTQELLASSRADLTWGLFKRNLRNALDYADYRIERVPKYEIQRCDLEMPPPRN
ncbi:flagellar motor control protein ZomB [Rhodococcus sp. CC-R104]|uniref:Flagellar motor control protein ZomB n=1 Tax=Rhodococcus chondri TaxID=3065941 RepID=A0ABU7JM30_9NOCA|nr:flagellar motor control protein ZomB [Rhodococcus sp. CC-R104]MEE2030772.1 flagellar motor control protein ZomB [Rhodococcus sp. CC-R104]